MKKFETMTDINKAYSNVVANLLAGGATIFPPTMGGSQGEKAHVDLLDVDHSHVLRVLLVEESGWDLGYDHKMVIRVMSQTAQDLKVASLDELANAKYSHATLWNDRGEEVFKQVWYGMSQGKNGQYHYTQDADVPAHAKQVREYKYRNDLYQHRTYGDPSTDINFDPVYVAKFVKAHGGRGYGNCKPEEVKAVRRCYSTDRGRVCYTIHFSSTKKSLTF